MNVFDKIQNDLLSSAYSFLNENFSKEKWTSLTSSRMQCHRIISKRRRWLDQINVCLLNLDHMIRFFTHDASAYAFIFQLTYKPDNVARVYAGFVLRSLLQ